MIGKTIAHYEILEKLGEGGMGVVYKAKDTHLDRFVAIKVLPPEKVANSERKRRFVQEAKSASALNHPNIIHIYYIDQQDGVDFIAMEYVPGKPLDELIPRKGMRLTEVLKYSVQIADALATAHEAGIVHRDLKPGNVMVGDDGRVRVLDFGLAKLVDPSKSSEHDVTRTIKADCSPQTREGTVLGTVNYMSPEQAEGRKVDARSDIFSFGAVLYEMTTGRRAFQGTSAVSTLAAIIKEDPEPASKQVNVLPRDLDRTIERCLRKDRNRRYQHMGDVRNSLAEVDETPEPTRSEAARRSRGWLWAVMMSVLAITTGVLVGIWRTGGGGAGASQEVRRLSIVLPADMPVAISRHLPLAMGRTAIALSPDGTNLVYVADRGDTSHLVLRPLDRFEFVPLPGTEGAHTPFFSPDGQWIGFFTDTHLKRISVRGGAPVQICEATNVRGATWDKENRVIFSEREGLRLQRVSADVGVGPETILDGAGLRRLNAPSMLLGDDILLMHEFSSGNQVRVIAAEPGSDSYRVLHEQAASPKFIPTGHLTFLRGSTLFAARMDSSALRLIGEPTPVLEGVRGENLHDAQYTFSQNGTLAYIAGGDGQAREFVWVTQDGSTEPLTAPVRQYGSFEVSPDEQWLAVNLEGDLYLYEFRTARFTRLTSEGALGIGWSSDSTRIRYASPTEEGGYAMFSISLDGTKSPSEIVKSDSQIAGGSPLPDGKLIYAEWNQTPDIKVVDPGGDSGPECFICSENSEWGAAVSPDGRWVAYTSDMSGRYEVYVTAYPLPEGARQVSDDGGEEPIWSHDGKELFYRNGNRWMRVEVRGQDDLIAESPRVAFSGDFLNVPGISYQVLSGGEKFLVLRRPPEQDDQSHIRIVENWFEELKQIVPVDN